MDISFSPQNPPYAEVAVLAQTSGPEAANSLRLTPVVAQLKTILTIGPTKLSGSTVALRYLARLSTKPSTLYDESNPSSFKLTVETDTILDLLRQPITQALLATLTQKVQARYPKFLIDDAKPLLADYAVWGLLRVHAKAVEELTAWLQKMDALPECAEAIRIVDAALAASPASSAPVAETEIPQIPGTNPNDNVLDVFRNLIIKQIASLSGADPALVATLLEAPRVAEHGDFSIAVPRMKVAGNPMTLAKEYTNKVCFYAAFYISILLVVFSSHTLTL